jgi:hypothetical protein
MNRSFRFIKVNKEITETLPAASRIASIQFFISAFKFISP